MARIAVSTGSRHPPFSAHRRWVETDECDHFYPARVFAQGHLVSVTTMDAREEDALLHSSAGDWILARWRGADPRATYTLIDEDLAHDWLVRSQRNTCALNDYFPDRG